MGKFHRKLIGRTAGAALLAFILFAPSAAGACTTTPYTYTITYTPLSPASTPPSVGVPHTFNYFQPRYVAQSSLASLPATIDTATGWDNGTGLSTSSQLRPAVLDVSLTTYNYQVNQASLVDNWIDEGSWHWHSNLVDQGSNHWHSNIVDHPFWVSSGYWQNVWVVSAIQNTWVLDGFWWNAPCGDPGCSTQIWWDLSHWSNATLTDALNGNIGTPTTDTSHWETQWVDTSYWQSNWVDEGAWHWHSNWVDLGSNHWHANLVNYPTSVVSPVAYTEQSSLPVDAINVSYNAFYVTQDQYLATSFLPSGSAYQITYNYVASLTGCALPT